MLKKMILSCLCLLFGLVPLGLCADTTNYRNTIELARCELWKTLASGAASNASVAIMDHGVIVYQEAFGITNRAQSLAVTTSSQFNIGSISKLFVTTAILELVDQGKVVLDQPVQQYLPEFKMLDERYKQITVRMLLNHSAGFAGTNYYMADCTEPNPDYIAQTIAVLQHGYLKSNPGAISLYCNDGFTLAQAIVERVSGVSYQTFLEKNIFITAGMSNSSCFFKTGNANIAHDFVPESGRMQPAEYVSALGSGGISATAVDLCKFVDSVFAGYLLNPDSLQNFQRPQFAPQSVPTGIPITQFGLGWDDVAEASFATQGVTVLSKNGGTAEFASEIRTAPHEQLTVALLISGHANASELNAVILRSALTDRGVMIMNKTNLTLPKPAVVIPPALYTYEGLYGSAGNIVRLMFDKDNNTLIRSALVNREFVDDGVFPYTGASYFFAKGDYSFYFAEAKGQKYLMIRSSAVPGTMVYCQKLGAPESPLDTAAFADRTWVPRNFAAIDLSAPAIIKTKVVPNLPGVIAVGNGKTITAYGLSDPNTAKTILPYATDLYDIRITQEQDRQILNTGAYQYADAAFVLLLNTAAPVKVGKDGYNELRKVAEPMILTPDLPKNARLVIFSGDGELNYDSLFFGNEQRLLRPGEYLLFIGAPNTEVAMSMFAR